MPFLGYLFHDRFRIYGYGFQQSLAFSGFKGIVLCKNSFIGELFWHFRIYGYDFQQILLIYGYTFEKFLRIYGWYFYDLNGTTPYLGNSNYPPPPGNMFKRLRNFSDKLMGIMSDKDSKCQHSDLQFLNLNQILLCFGFIVDFVSRDRTAAKLKHIQKTHTRKVLRQ